jgi:hypothetical protein
MPLVAQPCRGWKDGFGQSKSGIGLRAIDRQFTNVFRRGV